MKILALTSIRSDYDLLSPLYKLLAKDKNINFKLLVSGAHLCEEFGYSIEQIKEDNFEILLSIETLLNSHTPSSRLKSASILLQNSIDVIANFSPDLILYAGDREDVIMGALLGTYLAIPTIHFYGGDHEQDYHCDTPIRHATSKLSHLHFVSTKEHKKRLISMGESKERVFNIGSISLDKFKNFEPCNIQKLSKKQIPDKFALLIYHPIEHENNDKVFQNILEVLKEKKIFTFISYPNSDPGYKDIINVIQNYKNDSLFEFYKNLPRDQFLSLFSQCEFLIGNSSAGIYEAATIKKPVLNVGLRQNNRMCGENVLFSKTSKKEIKKGIETIVKMNISDIENPYGDGQSAKRAYQLIKKLNFKKFLYKIEDPLYD